MNVLRAIYAKSSSSVPALRHASVSQGLHLYLHRMHSCTASDCFSGPKGCLRLAASTQRKWCHCCFTCLLHDCASFFYLDYKKKSAFLCQHHECNRFLFLNHDKLRFVKHLDSVFWGPSSEPGPMLNVITPFFTLCQMHSDSPLCARLPFCLSNKHTHTHTHTQFVL